MEIIRKTAGAFATNNYLISEPSSGEAVLIDAGGSAKPILDECERLGKRLSKVLLTHGHCDHISALAQLQKRTGCEIYIHSGDAAMLRDPELNLSAVTFMPFEPVKEAITIQDGDVISGAGLDIRVLHTPGHTPGGACYVCGNIIFSGDTLFAMSIGRTDFPGGSHKTLIDSIRTKLLTLQGDYTVYPGHGDKTSLDFERKNNPYL